MELIKHFLILLSALTPQVVAQIAGSTYDQVQAQLNNFQETVYPGIITAAGGTAAKPFSGCAFACSFLNYSTLTLVSFPKSLIYEFERSQYWSLQQAITQSTCRFSPTTSAHVSFAVLALQLAKCQFAVKSGGHAPFSGASSINGGAVLDLVNMKSITVSKDQNEVAIEPGNRWGDVYKYLDPKGLSVIGGRVSDIGVGGLTLGGGISFLSQRYGWTCDNVNNYQVVFANGSINNVNYRTHPDLFFALRGGGNNFGIVTRFDMAAFPQGDLWAGQRLYTLNPTVEKSLNDAFYWLTINGPSDLSAAAILAYVYVPYFPGSFYVASDLEYSQPIVEPLVFKNFSDIAKANQQVLVSDSMRITNVTHLTYEFNSSNPSGFRQTMWTLTTQNSGTLMNDINTIWKQEVEGIKNIPDVVGTVVYQPITTAISSHFRQNGGNALGFDDRDGPLILINVNFSWSGDTNDVAIFAAARKIINRANTTAYTQGLGFSYIYQNYAAEEQKVFNSYGAASLKKLREVSKKYDPDQVWQKWQPGYFKL